VRIEGKVNPIQRVRAEGISRAVGIEGRFQEWAPLARCEDELPECLDRLEMLETMDVDQIVDVIDKRAGS
jgi:hypothetical protein